ncbi:protein MANBAL-like [Ptychodera flava]|uniref:protein MANBAL-like n=1 Tax=Ptychodera flava TaxID=63121 RepID=UPI00396A0DF1
MVDVEVDVVDNFLHYGLLLGAVFQLIAIFAIVILPPKDDEKIEVEATSKSPETKRPEGSSPSKKSKKESKKRR